MAEKWMTPTIWTPQKTASTARRLVTTYMEAPEEMRALGRQFYPVWRQTAEHLGDVSGLTAAHGAAVMAHLSPSNEAELNRIQSIQMVHGISANTHERMIQAGAHVSAAASARGRRGSVPVGSPEYRDLTAEMEHHERENKAIRESVGIKGTPVGALASREFGNASAVLLGHHEDPLASLGDLKKRDFGSNIYDPRAERVAIDTQYHDAAIGRTDIPWDTNRGLTNANRYEQFQNSSMMAHRRVLEMTGEDISHPDMMAGIWYAHQLRKSIENPDSTAARRASTTRLARIRGNPDFRMFLPETHGLAPAFPKITGR